MITKKPVLIIAEAGVNHNGDLELAKKLIDKAAEARVDLVKFQTFKADDLVSKAAKQADYQKKNIGGEDSSQYQMLKQLELNEDAHVLLTEYARTKGIAFFSTAFDIKGLDYLFSLGFDRFKIPSGEITNYPYLRKLADFGKPVILSTGMSNLSEIEAALAILCKGIPKEEITVLHCNTEYPTPMEDVNLKAMLAIQQELGVKVGYSDHTLGIEVPIAAVALGATVIEKHFTLDRSLPGPDHAASLEPEELKAMVKAIRNIEKATNGNGKKQPSISEQKNIAIVRKSIHTHTPIRAGELFTEENLVPLRPGGGISPMDWERVIGKRALRDLTAYEQLLPSDIEAW